MRGGATGEEGFTLIEALVALVILSFSGVALLGATEAHVSRIDGLESRAVAEWVAENRLVELQIGAAGPEDGPVEVPMLGREWQVETRLEETPDPEIAKVEIRVAEAGAGGPLVVFGGFLDTGGPG